MVSNDMSDDESVLGAGTGGAEDDSDNGGGDEDEHNDVYGGGAEDEEEEVEAEGEEEDDVPEQDPSDAEEAPDPPPPKKAKAGAGGAGIMAHFFNKQGAKTTAAPVPDGRSKSPATTRPKGGKAIAAAKAAGEVALGGKRGATKSTKAPIKETVCSKAAAPSAQTSKTTTKSGAESLSFHNESEEEEEEDEEEGPLMVSAPKNVRPPMPAPDVEQDYLDSLSGVANACDGTADADGEGEEPPRVADVAKQRRYIIKNEKTGRWAEWKANGPSGLLYAPECTDLFAFTKDDLNVPSKKDRLLVQDKLANEQMSKIMSTMIIGGVKPDGAESNGAPGITNLMALIPSSPPLVGKELEELWKWMGLSEEDEVELVAVLALDHEIVKRVYKVPNGPLPAIYNPNTNSGNKYKVPAVLEKFAQFDDNFVLWTPETKAKSGGRKRPATEDTTPSKAGGKRSANGAKSTADGKRLATENEREEMDRRHEATIALARTNPGTDKLCEFFGAEIGLQNCQAWSLTCDEDDMYSLFQTTPGKWVLFRGKF